jgi:hypothetical protein
MNDSTDLAEKIVGVFTVELPPDWWVPKGYSLQNTSNEPQVPFYVVDPFGKERAIFAVDGFHPSEQRVASIAEVIESELGPMQLGFSPETRHQLGMDRTDPATMLVNRPFWTLVEGVVGLFDLANYGISATIIAGTQGMAKAGWMSETAAGSLRRDLNLGVLMAAVETGRSPAVVERSNAAAARLAALARVKAAAAAPALLVRMEPLGRAFTIVDAMVAFQVRNALQPQVGVPAWLARLWAEGADFNRSRRFAYEFNELWVKKNQGLGYWVLDSYGPRDPLWGQGPVSRKISQLAEIQVKSAKDILREAHSKYRPGTIIADVPSTPAVLRGKTITGQLFLEVPVQTRAIPQEILDYARLLNIVIRDATGKIY